MHDYVRELRKGSGVSRRAVDSEDPPTQSQASPRICPQCGERGETRDTRESPQGTRRRRRCLKCRTFWTTLEVVAERYGDHLNSHLKPVVTLSGVSLTDL